MIESVASSQPSINMIVKNDIYRLNEYPNARYGVFGWLQRLHSASTTSDSQTFNFTFFYIDRLTEDKKNEIEIQSVGVQTLDNIIRSIDEMGYDASSYTMQVFNQRFVDDCSGVFCNVSFDIPVGDTCEETFEADDNVVIY